MTPQLESLCAFFRPHRGVTGLSDWKFFAVAALQFTAFVFLVRDPWFGNHYFTAMPGVLSAFLALILVTTPAWEDQLLGPVRGANLFLQITLLAPVTLFLMRVAGKPQEPERLSSLWSWFTSRIGDAVDFVGLSELVPDFLQEIFTNPWLLLLTLLVLIGFSLRSGVLRIGVVGAVFFGGFVAALAAREGDNGCFIPATAALLGAIALQACNYKSISGCARIVRALEPVTRKADYRTELKLALCAFQRKTLSEDEVNAIVSEEFPNSPDAAARRLLQDLIRKRGILTLTLSPAGLRLTTATEFAHAPESLLAGVSRLPRLFFVSILALAWLLSPLDLIPDAIPFLGFLDDAAIGILSSVIFYRSLGGTSDRSA